MAGVDDELLLRKAARYQLHTCQYCRHIVIDLRPEMIDYTGKGWSETPPIQRSLVQRFPGSHASNAASRGCTFFQFCLENVFLSIGGQPIEQYSLLLHLTTRREPSGSLYYQLDAPLDPVKPPGVDFENFYVLVPHKTLRSPLPLYARYGIDHTAALTHTVHVNTYEPLFHR